AFPNNILFLLGSSLKDKRRKEKNQLIAPTTSFLKNSGKDQSINRICLVKQILQKFFAFL
ncbi:hypothetical protein M9Y82_18465, partial [Leptospira weilii]|uniref:hypothetical protein n=1 Tax=Leptospira weilii TaxID=28184 RepID=UPI0020233BCF